MTKTDLGPRYRCLSKLGSGGVGSVFLVRDLHLMRELALKLLHRSSPLQIDLEPFQREFALLSELEHPGVARAFDFGFLNGQPYFTREFIAGETLEKALEKASVDAEAGARLLRLSRDLADALAFLHRFGILHLDIKPANIIVPPVSAQRGPVLIDFGLFRRGLSCPPGEKIQGSLPYMAPEYFQGRPLGPYTDIYALGVTLYRMVAGFFPRAGPSKESPRLDDENAWEPAPRSLWSPPLCKPRLPIPKGLEEVILRCLALDPGSRFGSGGDLLDALCRLQGKGAAPMSTGVTLSTTVGRRAELETLDRFLDGFQKGSESPRALLLTGAQGMGQTQILRELKVRAQTRRLKFYLEAGYPGLSSPPGSILRCFSEQFPEGDRKAASRWRSFLSHLSHPRSPSRSEATEGERRSRRAGEAALAASAIVEPMLLAVDGLQFFDEVSISVLVDLIRYLGDKPVLLRPPIAVAVGYREEGMCSVLLRELTAYLLQPGKGAIISLGPLGLEESLKLYRERRREGADASQGLKLLQETGGSPTKIVALARGTNREGDLGNAAHPRAKAPALDPEQRRLLLVLASLQRPAKVEEVSRLLGISSAAVKRALMKLDVERLVHSVEEAAEGEAWLAGPGAQEIRRAAPTTERRSIHRQLARGLLRRGSDGTRLPEVLRHFQAAGDKQALFKHGLPAARYLKSTFQNRAALEIYRSIWRAIPRVRLNLRLEVALEVADLHSRVGRLDEGIEVLREILPSASRASRASKARVILRLATLHSRRGDYKRAEVLFQEGMGYRGERLGREERLFFLNERAAMKVILGEYAEALKLCDEGLRLAGRSRSPGDREAALNFHATRANFALRSFRFDDAVKDFETSLEIAEAIGSPANQAAVLNNLGILHIQRDDYQSAIRAFREAERCCLRLDEGPSLVSIYANLAVLYGKMGQFAAMEEALRDAERLAPGAVGRRQEFFLEHSRALCLLSQGRYADGRERLDSAIRLGREMGDLHVVAYDEVYRAEALVFEGSYGEAEKKLEELSGVESPPRVRRMALSRWAFLAALTGRPEDIERLLSQHSLSSSPPIPFLDAWDGLFFAWAQSIAGKTELALETIEPVEKFFRVHGLSPALSLALWVRDEARFLSGRGEGLPLMRAPGNDLAAALEPLLLARLLLLSAHDRKSRASCADLLAKAGAVLATNPLPEWSARVEALRSILRSGDPAGLAAAERLRAELARSLPEKERARYLHGAYWERWTRLGEPAPRRGELSERKTGGVEKPTAELALAQRDGHLRARLIARSSAMRRVVALLERLRGSDLPVLVSGETGSGKELVARILHQESRRALGPFQVIDCATIPEDLLEAELFGARAGAFTDLTADRRGMLSSASRGTVLIDEIGGASLEIQAKLLRVLSEGKARALGSDREESVDVRFLFATTHDLELESREGRFRADLLHRIRVITVEVPPLRERPEDFEGLVKCLLPESPGSRPTLGWGVIERLRRMPWPGNVRELRNFLARLRVESPSQISLEAVERAREDPKTSTLFPRNLLAGEELDSLKDRLERDYIVYHYRRLGGAEALCEFLRLGKRQLYRRCARLGIHLRKEREKES